MAPPKVLVVDDERSILHSTAALLVDLGYRVATCDQATEISSTLEREQPDVILQDVRMPGLDLDRLVRELRADPRWQRLPLVVFTASMEAEDIFQRLGARAVLEKPFKPDELARAVSGALLSA